MAKNKTKNISHGIAVVGIERQITELQKKLDEALATEANEQGEKLKVIASNAGYDSLEAMVKAAWAFCHKTKLRGLAKPKAGAGGGTRKRVDDTMRAKIIADLKAKTLTGLQIAANYGVSSATINSIKSAAGLTTKRE